MAEPAEIAFTPLRVLDRLPWPERFWSKVDKNGPVPEHRPELGPCWPWMGTFTEGGYGQIFRRRNWHAHRVAYELLVGPIPEGLQLDHLCRNRACCNPAHLEPVTGRVNTTRGLRSRTHCKNGHEFTPENTRIDRTGHRICRTCARIGHQAENADRRAKRRQERLVRESLLRHPATLTSERLRHHYESWRGAFSPMEADALRIVQDALSRIAATQPPARQSRKEAQP